jgi:hypothetical protein
MKSCQHFPYLKGIFFVNNVDKVCGLKLSLIESGVIAPKCSQILENLTRVFRVSTLSTFVKLEQKTVKVGM